METATFGAGCFWGVESVFEQVDGVISTKVGYTGGFTEAPSYEDVCRHTTGHAEAVEVTYDPAKVSYEKLLDIFWMNHDPTQLNRQGPDVGDNYRSVIFFHSPEQEAEAARVEGCARAVRTLPPPDRHRDRPRREVLGRRGVPPEVLLAARHRGDLQHPCVSRRFTRRTHVSWTPPRSTSR